MASGARCPHHPAVDRSTLARHLRGSRLFGQLPSEIVDVAAAHASSRTLASGETLWHAGQRARSFTVIVAGFVEIVRSAPGGAESLMGVFGPRESIGVSAVLEEGSYPANAVALTELTVLSVEAAPILETMRERPDVGAAMNRVLLEHTDVLRWKVDVMSAGTVTRRLAALFLHFADRFGDEDESGRLVIPLPLTRQHLARLVGARMETVIRALSSWTKSGMLETTKEGFVIASEASLRAELGE